MEQMQYSPLLLPVSVKNFEPLRAMDFEVYDISDAAYIGMTVYKSMTQEEKEALYKEALADDPLAP